MIGQLLFIFFARIIDVSLGTIRMILVIRGNKAPAAIVGFFEVLVYTIALVLVVGSLSNPVKLMVFCCGYAAGIYMGTLIEERMALGYRGLQIIIDPKNCFIVDELRNEGFPVTCWEGSGKFGPKLILNIVAKRNTSDYITRKVCEKCSDAFVVFMEPKQFTGGYINHRHLK